MKTSQDSKLEEIKSNQISQDRFEAQLEAKQECQDHKLEEMLASQNRKLDDIKEQIKEVRLYNK